MEKKENLFWYIEALVCAVIGVVVVISFFARVIVVNGSSMNPTLAHGDVMITRTVYAGVKQGDIVVIDSADYGQNLIKRVIAVENDVITIDGYSGAVYVNGKEINEPYIKEMIDWEHMGALEYPYAVPKGHIFVMGDNRNASTDSRVFGAVESASVVGKVILRVVPFSHFGTVR